MMLTIVNESRSNFGYLILFIVRWVKHLKTDSEAKVNLGWEFLHMPPSRDDITQTTIVISSMSFDTSIIFVLLC